jgi:hypothetical protein
VKNFIQVNCIRQGPGNRRTDIFVRADTVSAFGEAAPEYAEIGGVSFVEILPVGDRMILTNDVDDLKVQIERAEV